MSEQRIKQERMDKLEKRNKDLEERLDLHLKVTKKTLVSIPFIAVVVYSIWCFRDFLNTNGMTMLLCVMIGALFFFIWDLALVMCCESW
jgi:hypothetical protein